MRVSVLILVVWGLLGQLSLWVSCAPILEIPLTLQGGSGDVRLIVEDGDTVDSAVQRFITRYPEAEPHRAALENFTRREAVLERLLPELSVPIARGEGEAAAIVVKVFHGDDPLQVARDTAAQAGLSDDDSKEVVALVARRAQEQRLLPIMSMPFTLPDGSSTVMDVFKGDDLEEVVESFVEEHELPDAAREKLVQLAANEAKSKRLLPLISVPIVVATPSGEERSINVEVFAGEDIERVIQEYTSLFSLSEESVAFLKKDLYTQAYVLQLLPIVRVPVAVTLPDAGARTLEIPVYEGDTERVAVERFVRAVGAAKVDDATMDGAVAEVRRHVARERLRPAAQVVAETAEGPRELVVWYGDDVGEAAAAFAAEHGLADGARDALESKAREALRTAGLEPLLRVAVEVPGGGTEAFELYVGDEVRTEVAAFAARHGLGDEERERLLSRVRGEGRSSRVLPVLRFAGVVGGAEVEVPVFAGEDPRQAAEAYAESRGVRGDQRRELVEGVVRHAMEERLMPVARVPLPEYGLEFQLFDGDSMVEAARDFIEGNGLSGKVDVRSLVRLAQRAHVGA